MPIATGTQAPAMAKPTSQTSSTRATEAWTQYREAADGFDSSDEPDVRRDDGESLSLPTEAFASMAITEASQTREVTSWRQREDTEPTQTTRCDRSSSRSDTSFAQFLARARRVQLPPVGHTLPSGSRHGFIPIADPPSIQILSDSENDDDTDAAIAGSRPVQILSDTETEQDGDTSVSEMFRILSEAVEHDDLGASEPTFSPPSPPSPPPPKTPPSVPSKRRVRFLLPESDESNVVVKRVRRPDGLRERDDDSPPTPVLSSPSKEAKGPSPCLPPSRLLPCYGRSAPVPVTPATARVTPTSASTSKGRKPPLPPLRPPGPSGKSKTRKKCLVRLTSSSSSQDEESIEPSRQGRSRGNNASNAAVVPVQHEVASGPGPPPRPPRLLPCYRHPAVAGQAPPTPLSTLKTPKLSPLRPAGSGKSKRTKKRLAQLTSSSSSSEGSEPALPASRGRYGVRNRTVRRLPEKSDPLALESAEPSVPPHHNGIDLRNKVPKNLLVESDSSSPDPEAPPLLRRTQRYLLERVTNESQAAFGGSKVEVPKKLLEADCSPEAEASPLLRRTRRYLRDRAPNKSPEAFGGSQVEDLLGEIELDEPDRFRRDNRLRPGRKATDRPSFRKSMRQLSDARRALGRTSAVQAREDPNDSDGDTVGEDEESAAGDDDVAFDEFKGFIVPDDDKAVRQSLPIEFQAKHNRFPAVFDMLVLLAVLGPDGFKDLYEDEFFADCLRSLRSYYKTIKSSVEVELWTAELKHALNTYPVYKYEQITPFELCCDVCNRQWCLKFKVWLGGEPYNKHTHEVADDSSDDETESWGSSLESREQSVEAPEFRPSSSGALMATNSSSRATSAVLIDPEVDDPIESFSDSSEEEEKARPVRKGKNNKHRRSKVLGCMGWVCRHRTHTYHRLAHWEHHALELIKKTYAELCHAKGWEDGWESVELESQQEWAESSTAEQELDSVDGDNEPSNSLSEAADMWNRDDFRKVVTIADLLRKAVVMGAIMENLQEIEKNVPKLWDAGRLMRKYGSSF